MKENGLNIKKFKEWITASRRRTIVVVVLVVVLLIIGSFLTWALTPRGPMEEALEALESDQEVSVEASSDRLVFEPNNQEFDKGFVIYPGARVDFRSYTPTARGIAAEGFLVVVEKMPLNLAFFEQDAAAEVIEKYP
ncbi:MAG: alpha/beta hydrolase, partial [Candidatus Thermoplasmatota archaeon]